MCCIFFFFNDTATTEIYTLSLHDALPISGAPDLGENRLPSAVQVLPLALERDALAPAEHLGVGVDLGECRQQDRKSTRLNSSHANISYAVFCLKKKK